MLPDAGFSISLVVPSRGRLQQLRARLPLWVRAGFDEVVIVDGSFDHETRRETESLCRQCGAVYIPFPRKLRDTRSAQRNLGAKTAVSQWILFQDDDDDVPLGIKKEAIASSAWCKDWLVGPKGEHMMMQRRDSFLAFGGYPEDMVAAEDMIMSNRARGAGNGGMVQDWWQTLVVPPPASDDPLSRARNAFWYGATVLLFIIRTPRRRPVVLGDARRVLIFVRNAFRGELRAFVYLACAILGRAVSPVHVLITRIRGGESALRHEQFYGWQGLR